MLFLLNTVTVANIDGSGGGLWSVVGVSSARFLLSKLYKITVKGLIEVGNSLLVRLNCYLGGPIFKAQCIFEYTPSPQSRLCILLKKRGLIFGRIR